MHAAADLRNVGLPGIACNHHLLKRAGAGADTDTDDQVS